MRRTRAIARAGAALLLAAALAAGGAAAASAHIQVAPTVAAPNDPVRFTLLVPGESDARTVRVEVKVPAGVLPFSFGDTPGWRGRTVDASNGAVDRIVWTGRLARDGFAEFSFLAGTPTHPGTIAWKALQYYSDGKVVRWIGAPGSEDPAPTTQISASAPRQNAGGESGGDGGSGGGTGGGASTGGAAAAAPAGSSPAPADGDVATASVTTTDGTDWVARGLALAALLVGLALLALVLRSRGGRRSAA